MSSGKIIQKLLGNLSACTVLRLKNGNIACGCLDYSLKIYDSYENKITKELTGHKNSILYLIEFENGYIGSAAVDRKIIIWDINTGTIKRVLSGHNNYVRVIVEINSDTLKFN